MWVGSNGKYFFRLFWVNLGIDIFEYKVVNVLIKNYFQFRIFLLKGNYFYGIDMLLV